MKIIRDGIEIELSDEEICQAYLEQKRLVDMSDIKCALKEIINGGEDDARFAKQLLNDPDKLAKLAAIKRSNIDIFEMNLNDAIDDAVNNAITEMKELAAKEESDMVISEIKKAIDNCRSKITGLAAELGKAEMLAHLAEEAAELSQAALKLRRVYIKKNPTPVTESEAAMHLQEELADVILDVAAMGIDKTKIAGFIQSKADRWYSRVHEEGVA